MLNTLESQNYGRTLMVSRIAYSFTTLLAKLNGAIKLAIIGVVLSVMSGHCALGSEWIDLPSEFSIGPSISNDGTTIVSRSSTSVWTEETGLVRTSLYEVRGVSDDGSTVVGRVQGELIRENVRESLPAIWRRDSGIEQIPLLPGHSGGSAVSISDDGTTVVGHNYKQCVQWGPCEHEAFIWTKEEGTRVLEMPPPDQSTASFTSSNASIISGDGKVVYGYWFEIATDHWRAFKWTEASGTVLFDELSSRLTVDRISETGEVIAGQVGPSGGPQQAARWTMETGTESLGVLPIAGHRGSNPWDISADGQVVVGNSSESGSLGDRNGSSEAFVWDQSHGMRALGQVLESEYGMTNLEGLALGGAVSISRDRTRIVTVDYTDPEQRFTSLIKLDWPIGPPTDDGDMNFDGIVDATDINLQMQAIREFPKATFHDLDFSGSVDNDDLKHLIKTTLNTWFGDANLDGQFNSSDMVDVFLVGQYEDGITGNSGWAEGDWNADGEFTSSDFIVAFNDGGYEQGPMATTVPEPVGVPVVLVILAMLGFRRFRD